MSKIMFRLSLLATALAGALHATAAQAQPIRAYLSLTGADANPCTFAMPCKSAQHAHDVVAAGGEIRMLDPGSYGLVTINKAISILGDGHGGIAAQSGATAITINAGPTDTITLRGVIVQGFGTGSTGIVFNTGGTLDLQDCLIRNFTGDGIDFFPTASSKYVISDTIVADNGGRGIYVAPKVAGAANGTITGVRASNNANNGIFVDGQFSNGAASVLEIVSSVAVGNQISGVAAQSSFMSIVARDTAAINNGFSGFTTIGSAVMRLAGTVVTGNGQGVTSVGSIDTYGDNQIIGNGTDIAATLTPVTAD